MHKRGHESSGRCILDFRWQFSAGLSDSVNKLCWLARLADAFRCDLVPPWPHAMLAAFHNGDKAVGADIWWDTYVAPPPHVLHSVPALASDHAAWTQLKDRMPTKEELQQLAAGGDERVSVMTLEFSKDAFWPTSNDNTSISKYIQSLLRTLQPPINCPGKGCPRCPWRPSQTLWSRSRNATRRCFGGDVPYTALRLRRGDVLLPGPWQHYPKHEEESCSTPAIVAKALASHVAWRQHPTLTARQNVFVITDETNQTYIDTLRAALLINAKVVCFESDIPELFEAPDNYLAYCTGIAIAELAMGVLRFHPRNLDLIGQVCPGTGTGTALTAASGGYRPLRL